MASHGANYHLSENLIKEILSRLPVKSLLRFRCVCKYWYVLARDSSFIMKHFQRSNNNPRLIIYDPEKYAFAIFPSEILSNMPPLYYNLDKLEIPNNPEFVIGPFKGIFFLCDWKNDRKHIWNPATRESRSVLVPHPNLPPYFVDVFHIFGFGMDTITNNYKMVWIRYYWDDKTDNPYIPRVVSVYNLTTDSWRLFEDHLSPSRSIDNSLGNTYMNGKYYWLTSESLHSYMILSFDMGNENFQELPAPPEISNSQSGDLASYNDFIAMILFDPNAAEKYFDIWVMKEKEFWTKQLIIGPVLDVSRRFGIWKNSELLLETSTSHLVLYNNNTQEVKDLGSYKSDRYFYVFIFKESLVPVKKGHEC